MSTESEHLIRLANVLADRGGPIERILAALRIVGTDNAYLGFSALSSRLDLMMPIHPAVMEAAAPDVKLPDSLPANGLIRMSVDGDRVSVGVLSIGNINARVATEELIPGPASDKWFHVINPMVRAARGTMLNRTKFLTHGLGAISVSYPARSGSDESDFTKLVAEHMERIALPEAQRLLWQKNLYPVSGVGRVLSIVSECTPDGPTPTFTVLNDATTFDQAIDLLKVMADPVQTRVAAVGLGTISGTLDMHQLMGIEIVLGASASDVIVWLPPRRP